MDIIVGPRQSGKTTRLIEKAAATGGIILCHDSNAAAQLNRRAKAMGLTIAHAFPIHRALTLPPMDWRDNYFIDELALCLSAILPGGQVGAVTVTEEE